MPTAIRFPLRGFTLIELLVVIAILAILAGIAAPGMMGFAAARRVEDVARRLGDSIAQGRIEAVKRNAAILLCADASITDGSCNPSPAAADWAKGWRLCYDRDADGACDATRSSDPNPVRIQPPVSAAVTFVGPASRLRFNPNGSISASSFGDFEASATNAAATRWLVRAAASGAFSVRKA